MSWFDEQVKKKNTTESEAVNDMYVRMIEAVNGRQFTAAFRDERVLTLNAVGRILDYYNVTGRDIPESVNTLDDVLEYLLRPSGIMRRDVKLEKGWRHDASGAMLTTFIKDGKPVALIPRGSSRYSYVNPENGRIEFVTGNSEKLFSTDAIAFYKPFPMKKMGKRDLMEYIFENVDGGSMLLYTLSVAAATIIGLLIPWQTGKLFSVVAPSEDFQVLAAMAVFIFCTSISTFLIEILKDLFLNRIALKLDMNIEAAAMMRILSFHPSFFKNYNSGDLANRVRYMSDFSSELFVNFFSTIVTVLFSMLYIFQIILVTPDFTETVIVILIVSVILTFLLAYFQAGISKKQMELASKEQGTAYSILYGIKKIKLSGAENRAFVKWGKDYSEQASLLYNPPTLLKINNVLSMAVALLGTVNIYYLAVQNEVSISDYYYFNAAFGLFSGSLAVFSSTMVSGARAASIFELIRPIMEEEPGISVNKTVVESLKGEIEFDNVTFAFEDNNNVPIINRLNLHIKPGEYVGIVGRTGCGKSTLMRLMLGFETPQSGSIFYDKRDMNTLDFKSLRSKIGTVLQDGRLLTGSIFSNISINAPGLTVDEAWKLVDKVGLGDDIREMPMQLFTQVAESADNLSGGQKQRVMLARALASDPRLLILDEATSSLDNIHQKNITNVLDAMDCTKIVIAHSLSTVRHCDRILVLDKGNIVEEGTYDELIEKNGVFAELVRRQSVG
ncbi:MAG: ATP-binding cassette domain-containing protein [Lachnospiraceae bacterium]|nr:ATP-binding cassette domain-containing protein [Lachnospiraceae bacterium]